MARRQHLTDAQIAELFDPPTDQRELVRHYTLSDVDLAAIRRGHGDPNRLGHALMLCYLRYPGRQLRAGEQPSARILEFVADQIGVLPTALGSYLAADRNRLYHVAELQERLRTRSFSASTAAELRAWLLPRAIEDERFLHLARLVLEECRQRRIALPSPSVLERLCVEVRHKARTESHRRLTNGLSAEQRKGLDALTGRREPSGQNWLTWLRQMPEAAKPAAMLGVIGRLEHVRAIDIEPARGQVIAGRINVALIRAHWSEILRVTASIRTGTVTASLIMRQLASHPRQNGMAAAIRELGRLERTLFTLDWIDDPELRRTAGQELNKGEARNSLARAVFIHRLGKIRDRTYENQQHRASGLNLLVTAIILWNTRYLESAVAAMRQSEDVPDHLLAHLSPLGWEHVNLTGDYIWGSRQLPSENTVGLRPLRAIPEVTKKAA